MPLPELIPVSFGSRTPPISSNTPYTSANTFTPPNANAELNIKHQRLEPYTTGAINVLLLENISANAAKIFKDAGFNVETCKSALSEEELKEKLKNVHAVGIRSKSRLTAELIREAPCLLTIGCFCIGTNQVDCDAALSKGISVFNSPFCNSRSVAELIIAELVTLARQLGDRNIELHQGTWNKKSSNCYEVRGKTLGIVGYGHIGSQLSVLAEAMGLKVVFYDAAQIMPLGSAIALPSLSEVIKRADFLTLHVPETPQTINMIGEKEIAMMRKGAFLLNASRGTVVDIAALKAGLESGHLGGAALDVYPEEPESNGPGFYTGLERYPNVILTPHIGGSTEEAQTAIGIEVANMMTKFINHGASIGSVNFPELDMRKICVPPSGHVICRLLNVHHNVPGVLKKLNLILENYNIEKQTCESRGPFAYVVSDISTSAHENLQKIFEDIYRLSESVSTRLLY